MKSIIQAAAILRSGGLVAFPTETVYGLGADATNADGVAKIFIAKGRPATNPLICHVADEAMARRYAATWPAVASKLTKRFWPGPLTLVLPKTSAIVPGTTAGLNSVGLRAPAHELTLQLIRVLDRPIAGPSANRSNHISPTTARHVRDELGDRVDMILDGGACNVGIESTVLDLTGTRPTILRPGGVRREQIEEVIGPVDVRSIIVEPSAPATSPGQQAMHYAPHAPAFHFQPHDQSRAQTVGIILPLTPDPETYARQFYSKLREFDAQNPGAICIELPPDEPQWAAVRDRIFRASRPLQ